MAEPRLPIVTLTTDFGTADHYVAAVKASILTVSTQIAIVDITHDVPAHDLHTGGWVLRNACGAFPKRTVHVAVVDPGVGTARRPILVATENHYFIGPDNGLFSFVYDADPPLRVIEITAPHYLRTVISPTFHARDIFAPAAAHLARGIDPANFGEEITDFVRLDLPRAKVTPEGSVRATVLHVDRFGGIVLNVTRKAIDVLKDRQKAEGLVVTAGGRRIERLCATYGEAPAGEPCLLFNSSDYLEIALNQGRASDHLGLRPGDTVELALKA